MSLARKKMRDDPVDKAEIHAFRGVSGSISWFSIAADLATTDCFGQLCASSMMVRRVHQHAHLGLKIRRMPVQSMMLNNGGLVGSQGGYICGVTDKSLLEGRDAPWSPMAWRSFKMSRTVPSSWGAEAQAMSVALGLSSGQRCFCRN